MILKVEKRQLSVEPHTLSVLTRVSQFLDQQGIRAYLVGGFVRDGLSGRSTADIDIAVTADALKVGQDVASALEGKYVLLDDVNRICRVIIPEAEVAGGQLELDFSTLRGDIKRDLSERDFTIDAMAIDLGDFVRNYPDCEIEDPFGGLADIERRTVRAVNENVFEADAARLLRGVRLAAEFGYSIEPATESLIRQYSQLVGRVSGERVREELLRILAVPDPEILSYMDELGLLTAVIPELENTKGVEQPKEHFWDVFNHLIRTVTAVDFLLHRGDWPALGDPYKGEALSATPWSDALDNHFQQPVNYGSNRRLLLKLAALLHDIAKPQTKTIEETGRAHFLGHPEEGAGIAAAILERLRFSTREINLVELMVRYHMRPTQLSQEGLPSRRAIYRYFRDTGEAGIDTLFLSLADHLASRGPSLDLGQWREHARTVAYVLEKYFESETVVAPVKLIDGNDLMSIFGMEPGPRIGEILESVREAQAAGELTSREEALTYVRKKLKVKQVK